MSETVSTSEFARAVQHFCPRGVVSANFRRLCGLSHGCVRVFSDLVRAPYDPDDALYLDEADVRLEIARSFNVCRDCRLCVDLCSVFPSAFSLIEQLPSHDAAMMTPHQQDGLIETCHECTACTTRCPYTPETSELALDVWQLMVRSKSMRRHHGLLPITQRVTHWLAGWRRKS